MDAGMVFITAVIAFIVFVICSIAAIVNYKRKKLFWTLHRFWAINSLLFIIVSIFLIANERVITKTIGAEWSILVIGLYLVSFFLVYITPSFRKDYAAWKSIPKPVYPTIKEQIAQERESWKQQLGENIVKTKYMSGHHVTTTKTSTSSAVGRAVVGGAIAGDVGAIVGVSTAKQKVKEKHTTTFLVFYKDGHKKLDTVEDDTLLFEVYVDKLEIE